MTIKIRSACVLSALAPYALAAVAGASPTFSTINSPPGGEAGQSQMLSQIYGGTWNSVSGSLNFSNGPLTAVRLADGAITAPASLTGGTGGTDNFWTGGVAATIIAQAKYAGDSAIFGYYDDTGSDHGFHPIVNTGSLGTSTTVSLPTAFRWAFEDTSTGLTFTSRSSDNPGVGENSNQTYDQLVTYQIMGASGSQGFALFWEDRIMGQGGDYDYNDAALTVAAAPSSVPAPASAGLLGLAAMGAAQRRRRG